MTGVIIYPHSSGESAFASRNAFIEFSDGTSETIDFIKKDGPQMFMIKKREVSSLVLKKLMKSDDPSFFPCIDSA